MHSVSSDELISFTVIRFRHSVQQLRNMLDKLSNSQTWSIKIEFLITVRDVDRAITVPRRKPEGDHDSNPQSQAGHARIFKFRGPVPPERPVQTKSSQSIVFW